MPTIDNVDRTYDRFEQLLKRYGISVASGSRLETALLFARHVLHVRNGDTPIKVPDDRAYWREMPGIYDLAKRILRAERVTRHKFRALLPWLFLFGSTKGQLAQNAPTISGDQDSDHVFELLVALCLLPRVGELVPDRGRGDNPDLLFRFSTGAGYHTWGIACKRLYSKDPRKFRDTVTKGIAQIENSKAERGLVFVSLVNLVNHDAFYPKTEMGYVGMRANRMKRLLEDEQRRLEQENVGLTDRDLASEFIGKKALPGVVHYIGTTYLSGPEDAPTIQTVQQAWGRGRVNQLLQAFQAGLNSTSGTP
ncbi:MAG TPA: hypothetical protein VFP84_27300 [Kofleriaceae bacterium]|nr:hypothetical protein [Kofleriaceae bacterium]